MKYTKNEFEKMLMQRYPKEEFNIIDYQGTGKRGTYECNLCQKQYSIAKMGRLLHPERKHICPHCWLSSHTQEVLDFFTIQSKLSFEKIGYNSSLHKPTVIYSCNNCGEMTEKPFTEFLKYPTCIHCGKNAKRYTTKGLIKTFPEDFDYILLDEYRGGRMKNLWRHKDCDFIFKAKCGDLLSGHTGCPKCSKKTSKGEQKIIKILNKYNIVYEKEKVFLWSERKRYDFYLPEYNIIIEYHGIQHYQDVNTYWIPAKEQQLIDEEKEKRAIEKGFSYLIIPYTQYDNIEEILVQRLSLRRVI